MDVNYEMKKLLNRHPPYYISYEKPRMRGGMADKSDLFHNILNIPRIFLLLRGILDGGQIRYLKRLIEEYEVTSILDVACGCGVTSRIASGRYLGIDYNPSFISYCNRKFRDEGKNFMVMDASALDLGERFDAAVIINSIHHFSDDEVVRILKSMRSSAERLVIIHDAVPRRNPVSGFFYRIDRGTHFRSIEEQKRLIDRAGLGVREVRYFSRFPGVYLHSTVVCSV